jgi:hypothetical protein
MNGKHTFEELSRKLPDPEMPPAQKKARTSYKKQAESLESENVGLRRKLALATQTLDNIRLLAEDGNQQDLKSIESICRHTIGIISVPS